MTAPLRIGIVCYPTFGGSGVVATELGKALAQRGHEVHFITYSEPVRLGSFHPRVFYHEVEVSKYPLFEYPPYELVLTSKMVEVARERKLNLLHVHYAIPHASAAILAKRILQQEGLELPVVTTLHGTDITLLGKDPSFEPVISHAINESDCVTAVSHSLRADTLKLFGVKQDVHVVHNFVRPEHFSRTDRASLRAEFAEADERLLCHISNFRPVKRIEDVIRVFAAVADAVKAKLLMVGDGPDRAKAEHLASQLGVRERVLFLGKVKNPIEPLVISDLLVLPSVTESFGLVALEALAAGVPVISSNVGGLPEVNVEGITGFLHPVGDVEGMAASALNVLSDDAKLSRFRTAARAHAERFHLETVLPQYLRLYRSLLPESVHI